MADGAIYMRRELMIRLVRAFDAGTLAEEIDRIPIKLRPRDFDPSRCCVYHDRAVLKYRLMALLGFDCESETDELKTNRQYLEELQKSDDKKPHPPITVCSAGCSGCPDSSYVVTGNCRGCFARPCLYNCPKGAISIVNRVSTIDYSKCIKCGKCMAVCPFHAIIKTTVPCEEACPVNAIHKSEHGQATIDFEKCIFCGKCFSACPFGAIMERSDLVKVLFALRDKKRPVVAMVAPSATSQFPCSIGQLFSAISALGFDDVMEVALGAELTTENEAKEFIERMENKTTPLMTTSCCTAYVELVKKHLPGFLPCVSTTPSPMVYASRLVREKTPDAITVFIGPCIAKRFEAKNTGEVDLVLTFEELGSILAGRRIDMISQPEWPLPRPAIATARNFAKSCGVTQAVLSELTADKPNFKLDSKFLNGIDRKSLALLKAYQSGKLPANFLEVMACCGGCVNGPGSLSR